MSCYQREQPVLGKEAIGPMMMVVATPPAFTSRPFAQQAPKATANPAIFIWKDGFTAMFEVFKPALQCPVEVFDDDLQAMSVGASRFVTNRVPKFLPALLPRPSPASVEAVTQKVKTFLLGIHNPGLDRMQG